MESSSEDGSFVWTDASISSSSEDMVTNMGGGISGGEESENGKTYKKKLHKELYITENGNSEHEGQVRNKKRKRERYTSESEHSETTKKKIKVEPESDLDVARVHHHLSRNTVNGYDEHLLDEKVKKEQEFLLPTDKIKKKKRKKSTSSENVNIDVKLDTELNRNDKKLMNESNAEDSSSRLICETSDHPDQYDVTKKKKKKKKSEKREESPHVMESDDNTVGQLMSISNKTRKMKTVQTETHSVSGKSGDYDNMSRNTTVDSTTADLDISAISKISNVDMTQNESLSIENNKIRRRLSERIQFEDDILDSKTRQGASAAVGAIACTALEGESLAHTEKPNNKLKRFAERNDKLRVCAVKDLTEFTIGERDEVWALTCPSDVDVTAFMGRSVELEGRCKVKLQGAVYEGVAVEAVTGGEARAALLVGASGRARLRSVSLAGRLALHRRVPRAPDAAIAPPFAPAHAARVPLPDTKLRHPLLGAHYKKALKLPTAVSERLHAAPSSALVRPRRRKSEAPPAPAPAEVTAPMLSKKKVKRKKHDLEAAETWESERAIEESLFDF